MGAPPPSVIRLLHRLPIHGHRLLAAATFTTEAASLAIISTDLTTTTILAAAAIPDQHATSRAACDKSCYVRFRHGTHRSNIYRLPPPPWVFGKCLERLTNNITDVTWLSTCHLF
jgi:hypothetical protein